MSAQDFLEYAAQAIYLVLFAVATVRLVRAPSWATLDVFLFFAVIAGLIIATDAAALFGLSGHPLLNLWLWVGLTALPYVLLRLADDFRPQRVPLMVAAGVVGLAVVTTAVVIPQPWNPLLYLLPVGYAVILFAYASSAFLREARSTDGVTRRRMQAVALGSGLFALLLLLVGVRIAVPATAEVIGVTTQVLSLVLVLAYFVGFVPPALLRRAWQEPVLRGFVAEASELVQLPDTHAIADRIRTRAAAATGADGANIGLWDEAAGHLVFRLPDGELMTQLPGEWIGGRAFARQEIVFTAKAERDAPEHADAYRKSSVHAIGAAPITAGEHRLGVLVIYAARPPLFTDDVLSLLELIAEQSALVLRGQQLLQEAAQVRALAEVTRLKDDFLSVVAHDVRTPLTTILLNAELLQHAADPDGVEARRAASLRSEALRLKQLVEDYLDVVRAEHGSATRFEAHDLVALVREALSSMGHAAGRVRLEGDGVVDGTFDGRRIQQLVQNLVSNAVKYSEPGAEVLVDVRAEDGDAVLAVTDRGIGIPEADITLLFERFHRGTNADDRRYAGLGLGLYIVRQIAEEHGGSIAVSSRVGEGTTFTVRLARSRPIPADPSPARGEPAA